MTNLDYLNLTDRELQKNVFGNGRVDIVSQPSSNNGTPLFLQDKNIVTQNTNYNNCRSHLFEKSDLEKLFFSIKNIEEIQNSIIKGVYERSNGEYKIDKQDYDTLNIIMRSTFLQYSLNNTENMKEEILSLNKIVLNYCIPKIYNEVVAYMKYRRDVSKISVPPNLPKSTNYNNTSLEFKGFF